MVLCQVGSSLQHTKSWTKFDHGKLLPLNGGHLAFFKKIINSGQTINIFNMDEEQNLLSFKNYMYMVNLNGIHTKLTE